MADRLVPRRLSLLVIFATTVLLSNLHPVMSALICYGIDGSQNTALPCDPNDASGPCCDLGWICLSNGLCRPGPDVKNNGNTNFYRPAGCTDPRWNSTSCFNGCNNFGGNGLQSCNAGKFCCADFGGCNCSSTSLFNLGTASFVTTLPLTVPTPTPSSSSKPASTSVTTTSASSSSTSSSGPTSLLPASPGNSPEPSSEKSNGAALGAGIGVGLGVPIIALSIILYILVRRHKKKNAEPQYHAASYAPTQEMEAPPVVHEAPSYQKYAHHESPAPAPAPAPAQELDSSGMTFTPGVGWHK